MKKCRSLNASLGTRATASRGRNYGQKKNKYDKDKNLDLFFCCQSLGGRKTKSRKRKKLSFSLFFSKNRRYKVSGNFYEAP